MPVLIHRYPEKEFSRTPLKRCTTQREWTATDPVTVHVGEATRQYRLFQVEPPCTASVGGGVDHALGLVDRRTGDLDHRQTRASGRFSRCAGADKHIGDSSIASVGQSIPRSVLPESVHKGPTIGGAQARRRVPTPSGGKRGIKTEAEDEPARGVRTVVECAVKCRQILQWRRQLPRIDRETPARVVDHASDVTGRA